MAPSSPTSSSGIPWHINLCVWAFVLTPSYVGIAVWQHFYTKTTVHPLWNPARSTNTSTDMRGEFAGILIFSAITGTSNLIACTSSLLLPLLSAHADDRLPGARGPGRRSACVATLYYVAACLFTLFAASVLFVAPFVTPAWSWRSVHAGSCDGLDLWARLDTPGARQANEITFENRLSGATFSMAMSPDPVAAGFDETGTYNFTVTSSTSPGFRPAWDRIEYDLSSGRYTLHARNGSAVERAEFTGGKRFRLPALGMRGDLARFEERCVFDPTASVRDGGGREGQVVLRTAQFEICGGLVACARERVGAEGAAVPVGLVVLARARRGGGCCRGRRVPGVEGRDYQ